MNERGWSIALLVMFGCLLFGGCTNNNSGNDDGRAMPKVTPWWEVRK